jgi:hypothetical protein
MIIKENGNKSMMVGNCLNKKHKFPVFKYNFNSFKRIIIYIIDVLNFQFEIYLFYTYKMNDWAERHNFWPQLWLFFSHFLFPPKKKKKRRMNGKNRDQKSCLSAWSKWTNIALSSDNPYFFWWIFKKKIHFFLL